MNLLHIEHLQHRYAQDVALKLDHLTLSAGEQLLVLGPSGCGKSTLLHVIAGLLRPSSGRISVCGQDLSQLSASAMDRFRGHHLGIIFQRLHLIPALTVAQNLALAQRLSRSSGGGHDVQDMLARLGIESCANALPGTLSQGQAQRVAVARALVHSPRLLLADEPTSSLDDDNAQRSMTLIREHAQKTGAGLIVVTHDQRLRGQFTRELVMEGSP